MTTNPADRFLEAARTAGFADTDVFGRDAVSDTTVPNWRLQVEGVDALRAQYGQWFDHPCEFSELRRTPLPDGELVELTRVWTEDGVRHKARHIHRFTFAGGRIAADAHWCGGRWPQTLIDEIAAAGHRV